ncbi:YceI family protein [Polymorphobacter arshaanensis]|uniref:YceI family protein n=1 Tax=Glacieibacterium arshaanense TaxID=2511025 RepID=UPI001407A695|nr:YceI family protein [Polymorphobacter arshaanensis]
MASRVARTLLGLALLAAPLQAAVPSWSVEPGASAIAFTATWLGKPVHGLFKRWTADIAFDPAALEASRVSVSIDLTSAVSGESTVDGALPESDWFAVKSGPTARFTSTSIAKTATGYIAHGTLTLRGRAVPVDLPFTLAITGDRATMQGSAKLDRRSWKIGLESDATAEYVAFAVPVAIKVSAKRKP